MFINVIDTQRDFYLKKKTFNILRGDRIHRNNKKYIINMDPKIKFRKKHEF